MSMLPKSSFLALAPVKMQFFVPNSINNVSNYLVLMLKIFITEETILVHEEELIPFFDTPHVFKGIRNNLLTKNL